MPRNHQHRQRNQHHNGLKQHHNGHNQNQNGQKQQNGHDLHQNGINFLKNGEITNFAHPIAIPVPVTSRSVGFCTAEAYRLLQIFNLGYDYESDIHKMYRVFLALFQGKVCSVSRVFYNLDCDTESFRDLGVIKSLVSGDGMEVPSTIAALIRAVGKIEADGKEFVPFIAPNNCTSDGAFIPQSEHVYLYNLRETVLALQNPTTPVEYRRAFYEHNPIPGTVWRNAPNDPILINADEIIPSDYDVKTHLFNEFLQVEKALKSDSVYKGSDDDDDNAYYRKPFKSERINFSGLTVDSGVKSLLMCNSQTGMKVSDKMEYEDSGDYKPTLFGKEQCHFKLDSQNLVKFSKTDKLVIEKTIHQSSRGNYFDYLLGERPLFPSLCHPHYVSRDFLACCQHSDDLTAKVIPIPITTRAIGFGVAKIFRHLWNLRRPLEDGNIYQAYRTCLYLIQLKILNAKLNTRYLPENVRDYQYHLNRTWTTAAYNFPRFMLAPIADIINTVGYLEAEGKVFLPVVTKDNQTDAGGFIPQSEHVFLYNLRDIVQALADENTPVEYRTNFYENNPIPGTVWRGVPEDPVLINPDDVIPQEYCEEDLLQDFDSTSLVMSVIGQSKPELERDPIDMDMVGMKEMLTCNDQSKMRVIDRLSSDSVDSYHYKLRIEGDVSVFHNYTPLNSDEQTYANTCLLGERPVLAAHLYPYYVNRDKRVCVESCTDGEMSFFKCYDSLYSNIHR